MTTPKRIRRKGYSLKPGEIGCFLSHASAWKKCQELNEPIVVLEDDLHVSPTLPDAINQAIPYVEKLGFLRLGRVLPESSIDLLRLQNDLRIVKYTKPVKGGQGYILTPKAAQKLIHKAASWHDPVDDFIEKEWLHKVDVYGVEPAPLNHDLELESEIGNRGKPKTPVWKRCRREIYRSSEWCLQQVHLIPLILKIKLGLLKIEQDS